MTNVAMIEISRTTGRPRFNAIAPLLMAGIASAAIAFVLSPAAKADEGGVSMWLPGIYASLAAVPLQPGWTVNETYYHWQGQAGADVAVAREITIGRFSPSVTLNLSGNLNALADIVFGTAIYTFAEPVLGARQASGCWPLTAAPTPP
jgi:hypothetical protein